MGDKSTTMAIPVRGCDGAGAAPVKGGASRGLGRATEGAVVAEYVILLVLVAIGAGAGTVALGVPLLRLHRYTQMILVAPFP